MNENHVFQVLLWPRMEVAARVTTLAEAAAWASAYNAVMQGDARQAIIAVERRDGVAEFSRPRAAA